MVCASGAQNRLSSAGYRRRARRLRHIFADDTAQLQRSLRELSREADTERPRPTVTSGEIVLDGGAGGAGGKMYRTFSREVLAGLEGPVMRYSQRQALLKRAARLGIGRFEANLVIALVQHRAGETAGGCQERWTRGFARGLVAFLVLQGAILAGAFWILR